jgi:hypothetical protein
MFSSHKLYDWLFHVALSKTVQFVDARCEINFAPAFACWRAAVGSGMEWNGLDVSVIGEMWVSFVLLTVCGGTRTGLA